MLAYHGVVVNSTTTKKVQSYRMSPDGHLTKTQNVEGKTSLDTLTPVTAPVADDEDERRRAGRGAGGNTASPTHAQLGANIRPDVVDAPGGLQVITTQKSADYRPDRAEQDYVRGELAEANRLATAPVGYREAMALVEGRPVSAEEAAHDFHDSNLEAARAIARNVDDFKDRVSPAFVERLQSIAATAHAYDDYERGAAFLRALDDRIATGDPELTPRLAALKEGIGDMYPEATGAATLGRDIRLGEGFTRWTHTRELAGDLLERAPEEAQQLDILNRSNEESTRRQSAELAARKGEDSPVISPSDYVASELRAAEKEAMQHCEAEAEIVISRDHPGDHPTVGGRGMFCIT
jgi:hypothetical protein